VSGAAGKRVQLQGIDGDRVQLERGFNASNV
jgi:hypothetical protein